MIALCLAIIVGLALGIPLGTLALVWSAEMMDRWLK